MWIEDMFCNGDSLAINNTVKLDIGEVGRWYHGEVRIRRSEGVANHTCRTANWSLGTS